MSPESEKYADKIAKLLRKAESTEVEAEADAFIAKAQELMTTYSIDEAMLAQARGEQEKKEEIIEVTLDFTGTYRREYRDICQTIANANGLKCLFSDRNYLTPKISELHIIGFESDVRRVELLNSSLQIQAIGAMKRWYKDAKDEMEWLSSYEKQKEKMDFLEGFQTGLRRKLREGREAGEAEAARHEAERSGTSEEEATESVALVVRSRKDQIKDWVDESYGKLGTYRGGRRGSGGWAGGHGAGSEAGYNADTSTGSGSIRGGNGGALGSGS